MRPVVITGATHAPGQPEGWNEDSFGKVEQLPLRFEMIDEQPFMVSAWMPTAEERAAISKGHPILLRVAGTRHPVVALSVSETR